MFLSDGPARHVGLNYLNIRGRVSLFPTLPDWATKPFDAEKKFASRVLIGPYLRAISVIINSLYVNDSRGNIPPIISV